MRISSVHITLGPGDPAMFSKKLELLAYGPLRIAGYQDDLLDRAGMMRLGMCAEITE